MAPSLVFLVCAVVLVMNTILFPTNGFAPSRTVCTVVPKKTMTTTTTSLHMGLLNRFRKKKEVQTASLIRTGQTLPEVDVQVVVSTTTDVPPTQQILDSSTNNMNTNEATTTATATVTTTATTTTATIREVVGGPGINLLIGMPGAYTPTCSESHMPGYIQAAEKLRTLGVHTIAVVTTNDKFVNSAWAKDLGISVQQGDTTKANKGKVSPPITILADGDGELVQQLGLVEDMGYGIGIRSKRFVVIVKDGVVVQVEVDEGMDTCEKTRADNIIKILTPEGIAVDNNSDVNMGAAVGIGLAVAAGVAYSMFGGIDGGIVSSSSSSPSDGFSLLEQFRN